MSTTSTMEDLKAFLGQFRVKRTQGNGERRDPFTHVTKTSPQFPSGSYYIPNDYLESFLTYYANAVRTGCAPTLAERPGAYGPLRVDFDFTASLDTGLERQYNVETLREIVGYYQNEIRKAVDPEEFTEEMLTCIALEKEAPRVEEGKVKDGFHLHFPYFICDGRLQDYYLRDRVSAKMIENKTWAKGSFANNVDTFIDQRMASKPWMMYGSMNYKGKHSTPYEYNRQQGGHRDPWKKIDPENQWGRAFNHKLEETTLLDIFADEMAGRSNSIRYYLPRFMTIRGYTEATKLVADVERKLVAFGSRGTNQRRKRVINKKRSIEEVMQDIKMLKDGHIMEMLGDDRADVHDSWIDVGWTLFNVGQGHEETLEMWIEFSQRSAKFKNGECEDRWSKMELRDKTVASLLAMAREDNPMLYKQWKDTNVRHFLYRSLYEPKPTEFDVAMVVVSLYKDRFVCADAKKDVWYEFRDHRWNQMDDNIALKNLLVDEVIEKYYAFKAEIVNQQVGADEVARGKLELNEKRIGAIISKLKTVNFHDLVIKMCKLKMHDSFFHKKMNENRMLICCENGVLDLELGVFRDGRPDDYCTFSTGLHYQEYNLKDEDVDELDEFLIKVFPNENRRNYFIDMATSCLQGGNVNKRFIVGTGGGDNSKSVTFALLEMVFGEYFGKFPRELLIRGRGNSSGAARPELAHVRGKRIMGVQEIAHTDDMNIGVLKELTGNDSFFTRGLYEKGTEVRPMFTLWMQCQPEGTFVALPGGFSVPIESLTDNKTLLSWNNNNGIIRTIQTGFLDQGYKNCMTLTLLDGTEVVCTPDHRLLNSDGEWVYARDVVVGKTSFKASAYYPQYADILPSSYKFLEYDLNDSNDRLAAMAVSRIMGYVLADGSRNTGTNSVRTGSDDSRGIIVILLGHKIDAEQVVEDIRCVTGKSPTIGRDKSVFRIHIPAELKRQLDRLSAPQVGGCINNGTSVARTGLGSSKGTTEMTLPSYMFDKDCPIYLVRELIAGMFGGDGIVPGLCKKQTCNFGKLSLIASKTYEFVDSLVEKFEELSELMKRRLDIESVVQTPMEYEPGKFKVLLTIRGDQSTQDFIEKVGVRYCCHKSYRLTAVRGYHLYKKAIFEQNSQVMASIIEYRKSNGMTIKDAREKATSDLTHVFCKDALVSYSQVRRRVWKNAGCLPQQIDTGSARIDFDTSVGCVNRHAEKFLLDTGLIDFCNDGIVKYAVDFDASSLPCYNMPVVGVRAAGKKHVYDLTVETPFSNFLANGLVSHNCNDPPKVPGHDAATWFRIRVLDFESKFVKPQDLETWPVPNTFAKQLKMKRFKADPEFAKNLDFLAPVLLWKLFRHYPTYRRDGLKEPKEVMVATDAYKGDNDIYLEFIRDRIERVDEEEDAKKTYVRLADMYVEFKDWYRENHPSYARDMIGKSMMKNELNRRLGVIRNADKDFYGFGKLSRWWGYRMIQEEDQVDEVQKLLAREK